MLSLTRKADYALIAAVYLARQAACGAGPVSAREIGSQFDLPVPVLMNVLKQLASAGLLRSTRGIGGGYELALSPSAVSLVDVVQAVAEGDAEVAEADAEAGAGGGALRALRDRLDGFFRRMTLAELLQQTAGNEREAIVRLRGMDESR
ncbi:MAG: Rrf2 family transcriptional regulator [Phycisphaeraceae bacterium]